jgi:hypothetical protein
MLKYTSLSMDTSAVQQYVFQKSEKKSGARVQLRTRELSIDMLVIL